MNFLYQWLAIIVITVQSACQKMPDNFLCAPYKCACFRNKISVNDVQEFQIKQLNKIDDFFLNRWM